MATTVATLAGIIITALWQRINILQPVLIATLIGMCAFVGIICWGFGQMDKDTMGAVTSVASNMILLGIILCFILTAITRTLNAAFTGAAVGATTLKYAIRSLLVATGVGIAVVALTEAINAFCSKSSEAKDKASEQAEAMKEMNSAADEVKNAYDSTLKSTYSELMSKYDKLKEGWKALSTEQQKMQWIKQNQSAFDDLRLKIDSVTEAENIFNNKTDAVVEAFKQRAMAAAYAAKLAALYQKQIDLLDKKKKVTKSISDDAKNSGRNAKEGDIVPENWRNERYGKVGNDGEWRFTKIGAERYNGTNVSGNKQIYSIDKSLNAVNQEITDTQKQLAENLETNKGFITAGKPVGNIANNTANTPSAVEPKTYIEKLQAQLSAAQKTKDNALTIEARVEADAKVKKIQAEIDEATKGKVSIEAATEPTYIVAGSAADKRKSYSNAQQRIGNIRQDYDSGLIDKASAQKAIADINDQLSALGLKPIEVHFKTPVEELQEQLQNAQRSLNEATTIEAKVKASAKIAEIQAEIDEATKGEVSIAAEVEPEYIEQGSVADKRQSYSNAQQKASRIQSDFEIGIIGKDEAMKQLEDLDAELTQLGLKPLKIDIKTSDIDDAKKKMEGACSAASAMGSSLSSLGNAIGVPELNVAGVLAQAIAVMTEGFATATAQAATLGPWAWIGFAATGIAQLAAMISAMKNLNGFASGGVVGVRSTFGDREVPGKRARALGCVCDAFSIRAPRSRRGGERRTRNRRPGGNRRPVDVRDERIAARVAQLGIVRRPVAIRIGDDRICPRVEFLDVDEAVAVRVFHRVGKERNRAVCSFPRVGHAVAICVGGMRIRPGAEFGKIGKSVAVGIERRVGSVCGIESVPLLPPVGHAVAILIDDADDMEKISPWHIFLLATRLRPKELKSSLARILEVFYL